jgi:hypothetical protein
MTPKIAAFAPMPRASVRAIVAVNPGDRRTIRRARRTSCPTRSSDRARMPLWLDFDMTLQSAVHRTRATMTAYTTRPKVRSAANPLTAAVTVPAFPTWGD